MTLCVYNTLGRTKQPFEPTSPGRVSMYVCGPTVYDSCHIGHARSVIVFDVIVKYLRASGYEVTYVRNFTDIDDKIIIRARETGCSSKEIAEKYIGEFHDDMKALNLTVPDQEPRATEHMSELIDFISELIEKGLAYPAEGDVYYSVGAFSEYGKLSGRNPDDMRAGARVAPGAAKRNPLDFALWKSAKPGEPFWESPWGKGRPGWHIECSAMSRKYLGESFDIHGGGKDLIFPHHENEVAQSESVSGKPFVKYWLHNGFVNIDQEKMSKSLGNFLTIKDVLAKWHPETLKLFLLSKHYRSPVDFSEKSMEEADAGLEKLYAALQRVESECGDIAPEAHHHDSEAHAGFCRAMDDDFNTAKGIGVLFKAAREVNRMLDEKKDPDAKIIAEARAMKAMGDILGILAETPADFFAHKHDAAVNSLELDAGEIDKLVAQRHEARKNKDWAKADLIRDKLDAMNVVVKDGAQGSVWRMKTKT